MGYQINSTWTKIRQKDIKELNKIIDDEYCVEKEIGRKIALMKDFNKAFENAVEDFDFDAVLSYMKSVGWEWAITLDKFSVPTKEQMINTMKSFLKTGLYDILERNKTRYCVSSGGIVFNMHIYNENAYIDIYFDIAHFVK